MNKMILDSKIILNRTLSVGTKFKYFNYSKKVANEQPERVHEVYSAVAKSYDKMLDVSTLGLHNKWRDSLLETVEPVKGTKLLDVAGGQGAIAIRFLKYIKKADIANDCHVTVCDVNPSMMDMGKLKCKFLNVDSNLIDWVEGDAQNLPFEDDTFNTCIMSLGFRHLDLSKVFSQVYRVLEPGSKFYCMDVSQSDNLIAKGYKYYLCKISPYIGGLIWKQRDSFLYFGDSYLEIPSKEELKTLLENAGFSQVGYKNLSFGIAAIHVGYKK